MLISKLSLKHKISRTKGKNYYFLLNSETFKNLSKPNSLLQDRMSKRQEIPWQENSYRKTTALEMSFGNNIFIFFHGFKRYLLGVFSLFWNTNNLEHFLNYLTNEYCPPLPKTRQLNKLLVKTIFQTLGIILNMSYQWDCSNSRYSNEKILQKLPA